MPTTKFQEFVFGSLMSVIMVYGMEVYNAFLRGNDFPSAFLIPPGEMIILIFIVYVLQTFIGVPFAKKLAFRFINPAKSKPITISFTIATCTVLYMCPMMSMVATLMFKGVDHHLLFKWFWAFSLNFPMAFFWQILVAGPLVRYFFNLIFAGKKKMAMRA